ncbi:MAG: hypothetical protein QCI82_05750 [Candidatus Thermoplasmatota archaeon]|nr:hypothetical protein [Candidatus Thermoplasmatota archaeon]
MTRNHLLLMISTLTILAFAIPLLEGADAEATEDMKSLVIVSGFGGYSVHELDKAASFRSHLLDSCSQDDMVYLTKAGIFGSDGTATVANLEDAFEWLITVSGPETRVAVYIMDHAQMINNQPHFRFEDGSISASTIDGWLDQISSSDITIILNGERSGLGGPSLAGSSRDVICSMMSSQTYCPDNFDIARSLGDPAADSDDDGTVSYIEAFNYEKARIQSTGQVPILC